MWKSSNILYYAWIYGNLDRNFRSNSEFEEEDSEYKDTACGPRSLKHTPVQQLTQTLVQQPTFEEEGAQTWTLSNVRVEISKL